MSCWPWPWSSNGRICGLELTMHMFRDGRARGLVIKPYYLRIALGPNTQLLGHSIDQLACVLVMACARGLVLVMAWLVTAALPDS